MSATISKTTYTFVVLHTSDERPLSLEDAMEQSMNGNMVGMETQEVTENVRSEDVVGELVALGNDGEFFNYELGLDAV